MANITAEDRNYTRFEWQQLPPGLYIFLAALNIFLSITASLSNALILIALHKVPEQLMTSSLSSFA
jgi:outer membrane biogenesis lipoprotein LolB